MLDNKIAPKIGSLSNIIFKNIISEKIDKCIVDGLGELTKEAIFILYGTRKEPLSPFNFRKIDITKYKRFATYEQAKEALLLSPKAVGIGIVLGKNRLGNLCGVDIDCCIDASGNILQEAEWIIDILKSYTEITPSHSGLHILAFGVKTGILCKDARHKFFKNLEIYDKKRYFTLTGNSLNNKKVELRQQELNIVYDKYFKTEPSKIRPLLNAQNFNKALDEETFRRGLKNDKKLRDYWNGKRPYNNESSNDNGFICKLMYWCNNNADLVINKFINSPYALQKDELHMSKMYRDDYLIRTIRNCVRTKIAASGGANE